MKIIPMNISPATKGLAICLLIFAAVVHSFAQPAIEPGKKLSITGIAQNTEIAAVVLTDDGAEYYLSGKNEWPPEYLGKRVTVYGKVYSVEQKRIGFTDVNGNPIEGAPAGTIFIQNPVIKRVMDY
jgi:hypothetical protein